MNKEIVKSILCKQINYIWDSTTDTLTPLGEIFIKRVLKGLNGAFETEYETIPECVQNLPADDIKTIGRIIWNQIKPDLNEYKKEYMREFYNKNYKSTRPVGRPRKNPIKVKVKDDKGRPRKLTDAEVVANSKDYRRQYYLKNRVLKKDKTKPAEVAEGDRAAE